MTITINNAVKGAPFPASPIGPPGCFANNPGWCMLAPVRT